MSDLEIRGDASTQRRGEEERDDGDDFFAASPPRRVAASRRLPLIIGHRGASAVAPENTLAAFHRAMQDGADGIEFDVRLSRDSVPVVIHDADLRRTAQRSEPIARLSAEELGQVDVGSWFNLSHMNLARPEYSLETVPTLASVFELFEQHPQSRLYVELKCETDEYHILAREVAHLIHSYSFLDRTVVESFNLDLVAEIKRLDASIRTAALFEPRLKPPFLTQRRILNLAARCRADELALNRHLVKRPLIEEATARGLKTVVWTVDDPHWVARRIEFGIEAVITNHPALMRAKLNEMLAG